jgi:hypothetical protein
VADSPLAPLIAKLDRADETMRAFDDELGRLSHAKPLKVEVDVDFQSGWSTAYLLHAEPNPPSLSVLIGESLYHARSTLEHLVWALDKANHKKPGEHNSFPIETTRGAIPFLEFQRRKPGEGRSRDKGGKLLGVNLQAATLIERLQPYHRPNPSEHFLAVLNRMARNDRHRALHAAHVGGRWLNDEPIDIVPIFVPARGYRITEFQNTLRYGKALVRGTQLARWRALPLTRQNYVSVKGDIPSFIAFGDRKVGHIFAQDFKKINAVLRECIRPFEQFL